MFTRVLAYQYSFICGSCRKEHGPCTSWVTDVGSRLSHIGGNEQTNDCQSSQLCNDLQQHCTKKLWPCLTDRAENVWINTTRMSMSQYHYTYRHKCGVKPSTHLRQERHFAPGSTTTTICWASPCTDRAENNTASKPRTSSTQMVTTEMLTASKPLHNSAQSLLQKSSGTDMNCKRSPGRLFR